MLVAKADLTSSLLSPHFLILPSTSQSLLIKSLAVNELVLPVESPTAVEQPSSAVQQFVTKALDQLETYDTYNPLSMLFEYWSSLVPRPILTEGRKIRPGVYCMGASAHAESGGSLFSFFYLW